MKRIALLLAAALTACASPEPQRPEAPPPARPKVQRASPETFQDPFASGPEEKPPEKPAEASEEPPRRAPATEQPEQPAAPKAEAPRPPTKPLEEAAEQPQEPPKEEEPQSRPAPKLEKGTIEPAELEAGKSDSAVTPPELTDEQIEALPRVQILRGLLAQKERRLADTLRDLAAARQTNTTEQTLSSQSLQLIESLRAKNGELKRKLALATAGFDPSKAKTAESKKDVRFRLGGELDPYLKIGSVNGEVLRLGDLLERLYFTYGFKGFGEFVSSKLVEQEAARRNIPVGENETYRWAARKMAEMAAESGGEDKFRKLVEQEGKSLDFIDAALRKTAAFALRIERLIALERATPEGRKALEAIARQVYAEEYDKVVEASHIFYRAEESDTKAVKKAREKAEIVVNRISRRDASFETIARAESEDENSRDEGGDLGKVTPSRFDDLPAFNRVLFSLPKGRLSVVQSKVGIHVVRIDKVIPPSLTWPQAKPKILRRLAQDGPTADETKTLLDRLSKAAEIERKLRFR